MQIASQAARRAARFALAPLALALTAGVAHATAPFASVTIDDGVGDVYNLSLSSLLTTTANGSVLLSALPAAGTVLGSDANGQWISDTLNGQAAVTWHSWQTANGLGESAFDSTTNPWASKITFNVAGHGDPDMSYGFFAKNNTNSTQSYTFTYGEAIDPIVTGDYQVSTTLGGSLSNTDGSATVSPLVVNGKIQQLQLSTDGVNYVNAGVDVGDALTSTAKTASYGVTSASASGSSALPLTAWRFNTQFNLTAKGDVFSATGTANLTPIPEPQSYTMLLAGLGMGLLLVYRRNKRGD